MPPLAAILAQADASAISSSNPTFAYAVIGVLIAGVVAFDKVDAIIQRRKRQPTLDAQLERMASALTILTTSVDDLKKSRDQHSGHQTQLSLLERRCQELEKQSDDLRKQAMADAAANRKYTMETTREIFDLMRKQGADGASEIKAMAQTMNKEFQDFARQIGALTEAVKHASK